MKLMAAIVAAMVVLMVSACGGKDAGGSDSSTDSGSQSSAQEQAKEKASEPEKKPITKETFVGEWSAIRYEIADPGQVSMTGDLSQADAAISLSFAEDGSVSTKLGEEVYEVGTWTLEGEKAVATFENDGSSNTLEFMLNDDGTIFADAQEEGMKLTLAKGAGIVGAPEYDPTKDSKPITDISSMVGTWKLKAIYLEGVCMVGDLESFGTGSMSMTVNADGTGEVVYEGKATPLSVAVGSGGATMSDGQDTITVTMIDDMIAYDGNTAANGFFDGYLMFEKK